MSRDPNKRDQFIAGYVSAIADLLRTFDNPTIAAELLGNIGGEGVAKEHGIDIDIKVLRKAKLFRRKP